MLKQRINAVLNPSAVPESPSHNGVSAADEKGYWPPAEEYSGVGPGYDGVGSGSIGGQGYVAEGKEEGDMVVMSPRSQAKSRAAWGENKSGQEGELSLCVIDIQYSLLSFIYFRIVYGRCRCFYLHLPLLP